MLDYEKITARDLKRIVNREEATPAAIGLFVAYDAWRRTEEQTSMVTNELLRWIEDKWRFKTFANELDYWISLGETLSRLSTMVEANRAMSSLMPLGLQLEIFQMEGSLYAEAYSAAYEQAAAAGLKLKLPGLSAQKAEMLAEFAAGRTKLRPTPARQVKLISRQAQDSYTHLLALNSIIQDVAALLGITALSEGAGEAAADMAQVTASYRAYIDALAPLAPQWARQLSNSVDLESMEPDKEIEAELEKRLSLYLTPHWRAWARAGVNLRELANSATGIVDLIRHAELAGLEATLAAPDRLITQEQASQISKAVKAVALELGKKSGRNEFGAIYGEIYRKFGITGYKMLPARRFEEAMQFLTEWHAEQVAGLEADRE